MNRAYRLVDPRSGNDILSFALYCFATVQRQGLELPSTFTMTVNVELKVGSLEETLTVTGASPIADVQSTTKYNFNMRLPHHITCFGSDPKTASVIRSPSSTYSGPLLARGSGD